jgi:hypothetical protein
VNGCEDVIVSQPFKKTLWRGWPWSDTTNQTGNNLRLPLFWGWVDLDTGLVRLHVFRLPPGGDFGGATKRILQEVLVTDVAWV